MFLPPHSMVERREENPRQETTGSPFIRISSEHDSLPQGALIDLPRQITHGLIINTVAGGGGGGCRWSGGTPAHELCWHIQANCRHTVFHTYHSYSDTLMKREHYLSVTFLSISKIFFQDCRVLIANQYTPTTDIQISQIY